jgi:hypothetical protein
VEMSTERDQRKVLACTASGRAVATAAASKGFETHGGSLQINQWPHYEPSSAHVTNLSFLA